MKKIAGLMMALLLVVGISGCGGTKDQLSEIKDKGTIVVGTNSGYPPYEFYDMSGGKKKLVGYDIDLANKIAEKLGVKLEINDMDFDALGASLLSNKIDIVAAGMVPDEDRRKTLDFSETYFDSETKMVAKKANLKKYEDITNLKGKTIVVQTGTTQEKAAEAVPGAKVMSLPSVGDTVAAIQTDKADVLFIAEVSAQAIIKQYPDYAYGSIAIDKKLLIDGAAIALQQDQPKLKEEINKVIAELKKSGELDKMFQKNVELAGKIGK